jgi:hypothetical protein
MEPLVGVFAKDCGCATHDGPHWLHIDAWERGVNRAELEAAMAALSGACDVHVATSAEARLLAVAGAEARRLSAKATEMERRGITDIPDEVIRAIAASEDAYLRRLADKRDGEKRRAVVRAEERLREAATEWEVVGPEERRRLQVEMATLQQDLARTDQ